MWSFSEISDSSYFLLPYSSAVEFSLVQVSRRLESRLWGPFQTFDLASSSADKLEDAAAQEQGTWENYVLYLSTSITFLSWATNPQSDSNELLWQKTNGGTFTLTLEDTENVDLQWPITKYASNSSDTIPKCPVSPISPNKYEVLTHSTEGVLTKKSPPQQNNDLQQDKSLVLLYLYLFQSR